MLWSSVIVICKMINFVPRVSHLNFPLEMRDPGKRKLNERVFFLHIQETFQGGKFIGSSTYLKAMKDKKM